MGSAHTEGVLAQLRHSPAASNPLLKGALSHLAAEIARRAKASSDPGFFVEAVEVLTGIRGSQHAALRMQALSDCIPALYAGGQIGPALKAATELCRLSEAVQGDSWQRIAYTATGILLADVGDITTAISHHVRAIEIARKLNDRGGEIRAAINLGVALNYAGLFREAVPCFRRSIEMCSVDVEDQRQFRSTALSNLSRSYYWLGEFEEGMRTIFASIEGAPASRPFLSILHNT